MLFLGTYPSWSIRSELNTGRLDASVIAAKEAYEKGEGGLMHLNFMPRAFDEGTAYYCTARGNRPGWSNQVVAWSQSIHAPYASMKPPN